MNWAGPVAYWLREPDPTWPTMIGIPVLPQLEKHASHVYLHVPNLDRMKK